MALVMPGAIVAVVVEVENLRNLRVAQGFLAIVRQHGGLLIDRAAPLL